MRKMIILCGISGSGKSTYQRENYPDAAVCSADHYFLNDTGDYRFDTHLLATAHGSCLRKCVKSLESWARDLGVEQDIVIDNTNTTVAEVAPYAALALAYGYELEIIKLNCPVEVASARNTHNVPLHVIEAQDNRLNLLKLPPWWPITEVTAK